MQNMKERKARENKLEKSYIKELIEQGELSVTDLQKKYGISVNDAKLLRIEIMSARVNTDMGGIGGSGSASEPQMGSL